VWACRPPADEPERAVAAQGVGQTRLVAEIEEVRAAAHRHVLAGIDEAAGDGILERGGAAPGAAAGLEDRDPCPGADERGRGGEAGEPAADDRDPGCCDTG
jgi:hypothetical protein